MFYTRRSNNSYCIHYKQLLYILIITLHRCSWLRLYCTAVPCLHYCLLQTIIVLIIVYYYVFTLYFVLCTYFVTNLCYNTVFSNLKVLYYIQCMLTWGWTKLLFFNYYTVYGGPVFTNYNKRRFKGEIPPPPRTYRWMERLYSYLTHYISQNQERNLRHRSHTHVRTL